MNTTETQAESPALDTDAAKRVRMAVSAGVDGEWTTDGWDEAWAEDDGDTDAHSDNQAAWHSYHLIGDVLRAGASGAEWSGSAQSISTAGCVGFARAVTRMAQGQGMLTEVPAQVPVPVVAQPSDAPALAPVRREAANDGVFRWKMVSGAAALVAVLAVSWGVTGVGQGSGADVLAVAPATRPLAMLNSGAALTADANTSAVWVATPQGNVMRDARLQELMQAHRQLGGASALQAPAGFLRTATFDANQR